MPVVSRSERRGRNGMRTQASPDGFVDAPNPFSPNKPMEVAAASQGVEATTQGISILKEIFPEHGTGAETSKAKPPTQPMLQQLLGSIPSPARAQMGRPQTAVLGMPFAPPSHAPMAMAAPVMPPPPPLMPAPACHQEQWEPPRNMAPSAETGFPSYRERLRAGGRGAFQRAFDIGLMPKGMKQDSQMQNGAVPYAAVGDGQHMWNGAEQMQSNDFCGMPMQSQYQCMQQAVAPSPELQMPQPQMQPMQQQQMPLMMPQMALQQPVQMVPMAQGEQSPQMGHMQMPQMSAAQMQLPQMAMGSGAVTPTSSGERTPTEVEFMCRQQCMGILTNAQFFPTDHDALAAQLRAMEGERYED